MDRLEIIFSSEKRPFEHYFQVLKQDVPLPRGKAKDISKYTFSGKINQGLFHLFSYYLPQYSDNQFSKMTNSSLKITNIRQGFLDLLQNKEFIGVITGSGTDSVKRVKKSKDIFEKRFLRKYLGDPTDNVIRNLSPQEKKTIFNTIPYCYLCYGKLQKSGFVADHIEPFHKGYDSKFGNILLAHHKCNSSKGGKSLDEYRKTKDSINKRKRNKDNIELYLTSLKDWNKQYALSQFKLLRKYARKDLK